MNDNITREPYRNAWYKQLSDAVKKHDEEIAEMRPHLVPDVEEGDNGKILIAGEEGAFDWGQPPEELPVITEGDEGKVLKVDEGVPKWLPDTDSEYLLVTITRTGTSPDFVYTADKTYNEIRPFAVAGKVIVLFNGTLYHLTNVADTSITFKQAPSFSGFVLKDNTYFSSAENETSFIITADSITLRQRTYTTCYKMSISNGTTLPVDTYNAIATMVSKNVAIYIFTTYNTKNVALYFSNSNSARTEFDFINEDEGIKAHIDANRFVTITEIPKLPTATSADEGKVVMVDSNGDYVLGVASSGYVIPFVIDTAFQSDNTEVTNND